MWCEANWVQTFCEASWVQTFCEDCVIVLLFRFKRILKWKLIMIVFIELRFEKVADKCTSIVYE